MSVYINSQISNSINQPKALIGSPNISTTIGDDTWGASNALNYSGKIDDISIWNRALTEKEITALYESKPYTLNLKLYLQGFCQNPGSSTPMDNSGNGGCLYITQKSADPSDVDTVKISLVNKALGEVASVKGILKTNGSLSVSFSADPGLILGNQYYLKIIHRNSVETWSAEPVTLNAVTNYDLTTASNKAYGSNLVEVSQGIWAIFSGDIADASLGIGKQDGVIETSDYSEMENAAYQVSIGYQLHDITGDGVVETNDYSLMENNAYQVISVKRP